MIRLHETRASRLAAPARLLKRRRDLSNPFLDDESAEGFFVEICGRSTLVGFRLIWHTLAVQFILNPRHLQRLLLRLVIPPV